MVEPKRTFAGLAVGPSADGVDAVLAEVTGKGEHLAVAQKHALTRPMPEALAKQLRTVAGGWAEPAAGIARLDRDLGAFVAETARKLLRDAAAPAKHIAGVGLIGYPAAQTAPAAAEGKGCGLELGSASLVARETALPVVSGFSASDYAAGGVGGPVWAWCDWRMFRHQRLSRVVLQLGAICTLTFVGSDAAACDVVAYDTGPGTVLIDALAARLFDAPMDADGAAAARGEIDEGLLNELMAGEFFQMPAPKRTHVGEWGERVFQRLEMMAGKHRLDAAGLLTTVTELTARVAARDVLALTERPHEVILAGGGALNIHLAGRIRKLLSPCSTYTAERYGLDLRGHTATAAAMLAAARLDGFPAHCPRASGADEAVLLGSPWVP